MTAYPDTDKQCQNQNFSKPKVGLSLDPILSILECVSDLSQSFYEEKFFSVGMKFSKSTFGPSFLRDNF